MQIILKMLQSVDGVIARNLPKNQIDNLEWGSSQDKKSFKELTTEAGVMILGSTTFQNMPKIVFKNRLGIILTRSPERYQNQYKDQELNLIFMLPEPGIVIAKLIKMDYQKVVLAGGSRINYLFLKAGLVDQVHLTISPTIFSSGVSIIQPFDRLESSLDIKLKNIDTQVLASGEILVKYDVLK